MPDGIGPVPGLAFRWCDQAAVGKTRLKPNAIERFQHRDLVPPLEQHLSTGKALESSADDDDFQCLSAPRIDFLPLGIDVIRPPFLQVGDDRQSLVLIKNACEARHHAVELGAAIFDGVIKQCHGVVPGVRAAV